MDDKWFVLNDEDEESYSTVPSTDVICDDCVKIGEEVMYIWNKKKRNGKVAFIDDDFDKCVEEAERLNAIRKKERKREASFHLDLPRRAALKFKATLGGSKRKGKEDINVTPVPKKKCQKSQKSKKDAKSNMETLTADRLLKQQAKNGSSSSSKKGGSSTDDELLSLIKSGSSSSTRNADTIYSDSDVQERDLHHHFTHSSATVVVFSDDGQDNNLAASSSASSDNDSDIKSNSSHSDKDYSKEKKKIKKLASQLAAKFDLKFLEKLASQKSDSSQAISKKNDAEIKNSTGDGSHSLSLPSQKSKQQNATVINSSPSGNSKGECGGVAQIHDVPKPSGVVLHGVENKYMGEMYIVKDTEKAVEVYEGSGIFCTREQMENADSGNSATIVARRLLEGVFCKEALLSCSVSGLPPRGKGKDACTDKSKIKCYLCPKGFQAIISHALMVQKKRHWYPKKKPTQLRQAMGVRLCDLRQKDASASKPE